MANARNRSAVGEPNGEDAASSTFALGGLDDAVEILLDHAGIPHLYAKSRHDLFFAQGFNAARDRLFQLDLWRRKGRGRVSEVLGASFIERDRAARLFWFRGDAEADFSSYAPDARDIVTAFVEGVNAYVALTESDPSLLPFEFEVLSYRPGRFRPEDITHNRTGMGASNLSEEVARARMLTRFGREVEELRRDRSPHREITVPEGSDLAAIPDDVLRVVELLHSPIRFADAASAPSVGGREGERAQDGSNNWAVTGALSATGRAVLASDPHRGIALPSLRYLAHLVGPGIDVIGGGEPSLPGISIGHNGKVAFGFTVFSTDQEDLYCYETDPDNPRRYRYGTGYEDMVVVSETLPVRDQEPVEIELVFTRHGPVIYEDSASSRAYAARVAWLEPGGAPYLASLSQLSAKNVYELLDALDRWGGPGENFVVADTMGNIAYKPAALVPRRPNWDGLLPVPGDGRYEWDGFYSRDEYPVRVNPEEGYLATANACEIPDDLSINLGFEWAGPYRRDRIEEVLSGSAPMTIAEHAALQVDHVSTPARLVVEIARLLERPSDEPVATAYELLSSFDANLESAPAAAIFEIWYRKHLRRALLRRELVAILGEERAEEAMKGPFGEGPFAFGKTTPVHERLLRACIESLQSGDRELAGLLEKSLSDAVGELVQSAGADVSSWSWTAMHHSMLRHPLSGLVGEKERARLDLGPVPRKGDGDTVGCTTSGANHLQFHGADFRVVIDVGDFDASLAMNSPGQSGDPRSPHYGDLYASWAADETVPLSYTRAAVEKGTERRILLVPDK